MPDAAGSAGELGDFLYEEAAKPAEVAPRRFGHG